MASEINPHELLISRLSKYIFIFDTCAQRVRGWPRSLREDADNKWRTMSEYYRPSASDEVARTNFFAAVDRAAETECPTPEKCYMVMFACMAGATILQEQDMARLDEHDQVEVFNEAQRRTWEQVLTRDSRDNPTIRYEGLPHI